LVVEAEIGRALQDDMPTLLRRLRTVDRQSPDYLRSECLVHLVRAGLRNGDEPRLNAALGALLARCEANLSVKIPDGHLPNAAAIREEVLSAFAELFAADGTGDQPDELDFFECRFNLAFRTLRIDRVRAELTRLRQEVPLPNHQDEGEPDAYEDAFARVSDALHKPATQQATLFLDELWTAINALPPDERRAVVLCHVLGYAEESEVPGVVTAATLCKCTGRTIRNRLTRAAARLSRFKEDA